MCAKDEVYYLGVILDKIAGLNDSIREYYDYLYLILEKECEDEELGGRKNREIPF